MKKITFISIIIFAVLLFVTLMLSILYPANAPVLKNKSGNSVVNSNSTLTKNNTETLTVENIAKHSTPNDCYLIINNNVYNVSTYINFHPGGKRQITKRCGQEVTSIFASIHSNFAWDLLGKYKIGVLSDKTNTTSTVNQQLTNIQKVIQVAYPNAEIINIKPATNGYIAKLIDNNILYEVHLDTSGQVTNTEVANDEVNWDNWSTDSDDN